MHRIALLVSYFQSADVSSSFHIPSYSYYMLSAYEKQGGIK
jgi:hypothetical protein